MERRPVDAEAITISISVATALWAANGLQTVIANVPMSHDASEKFQSALDDLRRAINVARMSTEW